MMICDDFISYRQAQAGTFIFGGEKGMENLIQLFLTNALSSVLNGTKNLSLIYAGGNGNFPRDVHGF